MYGDMGDALLNANPSGGIYNPNTNIYDVATKDQLAAMQTQQAAPSIAGMYYNPYTGGYEGGGMGGGADHAGGEQAEAAGGGSNDLGGMYAFGGQVKKRAPASPGSLRRGPDPNPMLQFGKGGGAMPQIASKPNTPATGMPVTGDGNNSSVLNPIGQLGYRIGGQIPLDAGTPGVVDSVPIHANAGEYVVTKPSAQMLGKQNMDGLNAVANQPPDKQQQVRRALHTALTRAAHT
jgi:hypothetical protein